MRRINELVSNEIHVDHLESWSFIIGQSPSRGARSPQLWNAVYQHCDMATRMIPLDLSAANLREAWDVLTNDPRVIGGAITMPFKRDVASLLGEQLESVARLSAAVNCVYRDSSGVFFGANTDARAALRVIKENCADYLNARYLVLGSGGVGSAIVSSLVDALDSRQVTVAYRNSAATPWLDSLGVKSIPFDSFDRILDTTDVLINATSLGFNNENESPLAWPALERLRNDSFVFDVIYQPSPTKLVRDALTFQIHAVDGIRMNLLQAVESFQLANATISGSLVEAVMGLKS